MLQRRSDLRQANSINLSSKIGRHRIQDPSLGFCYRPEIPKVHRVPLKEEEQESWLEFKQFDEGTRPLLGLTKARAEQEKRPIQFDHPFVRVVGDFAVAAFNRACQMHVKKGENDNLHDFEILECKYLKLTKAYYFYLTIEAIEEGDLGVYEAKVVCNSDDGSKTLSKFVLTNRTPVGKKVMAISRLSRLKSFHRILKGNKAMSISNLSRLTSIYETAKGLKNDIKVYLKTSPKYMKGSAGKKKDMEAAELIRLKKYSEKAVKGLRKVLPRDILSLFPPACSRTTNRDGWSYPGKRTGMVRRTNETTCMGYDYYNPLKAFGPSLIW